MPSEKKTTEKSGSVDKLNKATKSPQKPTKPAKRSAPVPAVAEPSVQPEIAHQTKKAKNTQQNDELVSLDKPTASTTPVEKPKQEPKAAQQKKADNKSKQQRQQPAQAQQDNASQSPDQAEATPETPAAAPAQPSQEPKQPKGQAQQPKQPKGQAQQPKQPKGQAQQPKQPKGQAQQPKQSKGNNNAPSGGIPTTFPLQPPIPQALSTKPQPKPHPRLVQAATGKAGKAQGLADASLVYYTQPFAAPVLKDAAAFLHQLPPSNFAFDYTDTSAASTVASHDRPTLINGEQVATDSHVPHMQTQTYRYQQHFDQCESCRHSEHIIKPSGLPNTPTPTQTSKKTVEPPHQPYPFRVIMDRKHGWRTHGKFAIRPCHDHNFHLQLNRVVLPPVADDEAVAEESSSDDENEQTTKQPEDVKKPTPRRQKDPANFGKKNQTTNIFHYDKLAECNCGQAHIGLYKEGTHIILPGIAASPSHHPLMNQALIHIAAAIEKSKVPIYSEINGTGYLRNVIISIPNTPENRLFEEWSETIAQAKQSKQRPFPKNTTMPHPNVQLSLIWNDGVTDEQKKLQKLIDIEPVDALPFPMAFDDLQRVLYQTKNPKPVSDEPLTISDVLAAAHPAENEIQTDIKFPQERQASRQALASFSKTLIQEFKTLPKSFFSWTASKNVTFTTPQYWDKSMAPAFADKTAIAPFKQFFSLISGLTDPTKKIQLAARKAVAEIQKKQAESDNSSGSDSESSSTSDFKTSDDDDDDNDKKANVEANEDATKSSANGPTSSLYLSYQLPISKESVKTQKQAAQFKAIANLVVAALHTKNPQWLQYPAVDAVNSLPGCLWGSLFVHYNNTWSHSNGVYGSHSNAWHHLFGAHSLNEHVLDAIPCVGLDYRQTLKEIPQSNLSGISTHSSKNKHQDLTTTTTTTTETQPSQPSSDNKSKKQQSGNKKNPNQQQQSQKPSAAMSLPHTTVALPEFAFSPSIFRQGNLSAFSHLLHHLLTLLPTQTSHIVELHSGSGTISLHTLHHTKLLTASDVNNNNLQTFTTAANGIVQKQQQEKEIQPIQYGKKVMPYLPFASDELMQQSTIPWADVIILDPPRKGLDQPTLDQLCLPYIAPSTLPKAGDCQSAALPGQPSLFPFDLVDEHYVNPAYFTKKDEKSTTETQTDSMTDEQESNTTIVADDDDDAKRPAADQNLVCTPHEMLIGEIKRIANKNKRDKKFWLQIYQSLFRTYQSNVFSNTKEHHAVQLSKSTVLQQSKQQPTTPAQNTTAQNKHNKKAPLHWTQTASTLVYVSCGFPAFQRDATALLKAGWKIAHCHGHLLFPGSNHVETLTVFVRGIGK